MNKNLWIALVAIMASGGAVAADLAVLPVVGGSNAENGMVTEVLRQSFLGFGIEVQSSDDTAGVIEDAASFGAVCTVSDPACALQLGGIAGVSRVVVGVLSSSSVQLRLFDVVGEREAGGVTVAANGDPHRAARLAAVRLLRPELEVGGLHIVVDVDDAAVVVDGKRVGMSPTPTITLPPGRHEVSVAHAQFGAQTLSVDIAFAVTTPLSVTLNPAAKTRAPEPAARAGADKRAYDGPTRVFVLDVVARGYSPLGQALATLAAIESLQCLDDVVVVSPGDLSALVDAQTAATLSACRSDSCWTKTLRDVVGEGEVLIVDADGTLDGLPISARRYDLQHGIILATLVSGGPTSADLVKGVGELSRALYSDGEVRAGANCTSDVAQRLSTQPVSVTTFGLTATATVAAGALSATAYGLALTADDVEFFAAMTNLGTVAAVTTGVGLLVTLLEAPAVDWDDVAGDNDALVNDVISRPVSRRNGPQQGKRRLRQRPAGPYRPRR